jgi:hypothetical protein
MKKLIPFLFLIWNFALAQVPGTVTVTAPVAPPATNSNFGATDTRWAKGGYGTWATNLSQLQSLTWLPAGRRQAGMLESVAGQVYQLANDLTTWTIATPQILVTNLAGLQSLDTNITYARVLGYYTPDDGGQGDFIRYLSSSSPTNYGTSIAQPYGSASNRWQRAIPGRSLDPRWFGAKGNAEADFFTVYTLGADDSLAMQNCVFWAIIYGYTVDLPGQVFRCETPIEITRRDEAFLRLGITNTDTNDASPTAGWNSYARIVFSGAGASTKLVSTTITNGANLWIHGATNSNGGAYGTRVVNVDVRDLFIMNTASQDRLSLCVDVYNAGFIFLHRLELGGQCYGGIRLRALSELTMKECDVHTQAFGLITEQSPLAYEQGDMAIVSVEDCVFANPTYACTLLSYFREVTFLHTEFVAREYSKTAALWAPMISPIPCSVLNVFGCSFEGVNGKWVVPPITNVCASIMLGADGTELLGSFTNYVYPWTTSLTNNTSANEITIRDAFVGVGDGYNFWLKQMNVVNGVTFDNVTIEPFSHDRDCLILAASLPDAQKLNILPNSIPSLLVYYKDLRTGFYNQQQMRAFPPLLSYDGQYDLHQLTNSIQEAVPICNYNTNAWPFPKTLTLLTNTVAQNAVIPFGNQNTSRLRYGQTLYLDYVANFGASDYLSGIFALHRVGASPERLDNRGLVGTPVIVTNNGVKYFRQVVELVAQPGDDFDGLMLTNQDSTNNTPELTYLAFAISNNGGNKQATPVGIFPTAGITVGTGGIIRGGSAGVGVAKYPVGVASLEVAGSVDVAGSYPNIRMNDSNQSVTNGGLLRIVGDVGLGGYTFAGNTSTNGDFASGVPLLRLMQNLSTVSPGADDTMNLGLSYLRWKNIYAKDVTINGAALFSGTLNSTPPSGPNNVIFGAPGTTNSVSLQLFQNSLAKWTLFLDTAQNLSFYDEGFVNNVLSLSTANGVTANKLVVSGDTTVAKLTVGGQLNANSTIKGNGALIMPLSVKTATFTVTTNDYTILADPTSGAITANLQTAATYVGQLHNIINIAPGVNSVTIDPSGSQTINGAATRVVTNNCAIVSDGASWWVISSN